MMDEQNNRPQNVSYIKDMAYKYGGGIQLHDATDEEIGIITCYHRIDLTNTALL